MFGRSRTATVQREVGDVGAKAAERAAELATRAVAAAKEAQRAATPVVRSAAEAATPVVLNAAERSTEALSHAAERAAEVLSQTADRLAVVGAERAGEASVVARHRLADASEALAEAVRPKKKRHVVRKVFMAGAIGGGIYVLVTKTPLKAKLTELAFGPAPTEQDLEPITLPMESEPAPERPAPKAEAAGGGETGSNGSAGEVPSGSSAGDKS